MGMDVYGKNPKNKRGEYFRNSVWGWRPLWNYCCEVAPSVTEQVEHGHSNDGDGLEADDSVFLASILREEIASGRCAKYQKEYEERLENMPDQKCDLCQGTGARSDGYAKANVPHVCEPGGCNGCSGTGKVRPFDTHYPFDVDNVAEFAEFLENCGGFEIR
jgi:hypothetical protein